MNEVTKFFEANVLVYREDSMWTALALEMDIRGYEATPDAAIKDMLGMLEAQVRYAVQKGHPESVWHRADEKYWQMWERARMRQFVAEASGSSEVPGDQIANLVPLDLLALKHRDEWAAANA